MDSVEEQRQLLENMERRLARCEEAVGSSALLQKDRQLKVWLDSEQSAVPKLLLTIHAKRTYVLQHEEMLRATAARVREMQELEEFINPVDLAELDSYKERLRLLDEKGNLLAERAARVEESLLQIAQVYNSTVNMMACVFEEWYQHLGELEESAASGSS